jgi:hypothetical protein
MSKLLKSGLKWYRNSDEFTRAVAYQASLDKWDDALRRYRDPQINVGEKEFFEDLSGVQHLTPGRQAEIRKAFNAGQEDVARDLFASEMVETTMFRYRAGQKPEAFRRGVIGKMFGMFGTYPVQYVEQINQSMKNLSNTQRAIFAANVLGNGLALYTAFQDGLGINAQAFLPWQPMVFSGGPLYNMMNNALTAVGNPSYRGRQARGEVFGIKSSGGQFRWEPWDSEVWQWAMPYGFLMEDLKAAAEAFNNGEHYKAFLNASSAPLNADFFK